MYEVPQGENRAVWEGEMFRLLVENVRDYAIFIVDPDGLVRTWSRGAETLLGYQEDEVLGTPAARFFPPEDVLNDVPRREMEAAIATGRGPDDRWHVRKDGSRFWVSGTMTALRDDAGAIRGFAKIMRDRTAWWQAEEASRESELRYAAIVESALDAVITIDHEGKVVEFNPSASATFGLSRGDVLGKEMAALIMPPRYREVHRKGLAHYLATGEARVLGKRFEITAMRPDGTEFPVELAITKITTAGGPLFTAYLRDVTERVRQQEEIAEQNRLAEFGRDIGLVLTESVTLDEMLGRCAGVTVEKLGGAFSRIWILDEAGEILHLRASAGMYTHTDGAHARVPVGRFKIGEIARERTPHLTNAVIGDPRVPAQDWAAREGIVAFAGYPLVVEDRLIGVWAMFAKHPLSENTLRAMESVASGFALGIERKKGEEALRKSEAWLSTTLTSIGDAVIATDGEGRVKFMNTVAEALTGWAQNDAAGKPIGDVFQIVSEKTGEPAAHPVLRVIREGVVVGLANHTVLIAKGGKRTPIEDSAGPIHDEHGGIAGVVMVFRDVTEQRATQEVLLESEDRYRTLIEVSPQVVWYGEANGSITYCNSWWLKLTGLSMEESLGKGWTRAIDPDHRQRLLAVWLDAAARGAEYEVEIPFLRASDGSYRWHLAKGKPIKDGQGRVTKWVGVAMDIDDRIRADEERKEAKEQAERANKAKDQFLAVLSHELRTPLNPILLAASSMLDRPTPPEEFRPTMEMIRHNVNLQARLIDDLLDVMRIVQGKMPLHWGVSDCHTLIHHAVQVCQSEVFGKVIKLSLDLAAENHHVNADSARLQQVFWNLIKNAVKFSPEGGTLSIRTRNDGGNPKRLIIEVADTGIGIEAGVLPKIFDPFQQGETSVTRRFGGLGLGLAICRGVVEAHGGTIAAESPGKGLGTTFRIALSALPSPTADGNGQTLEEAKARDSSASSGTLKVLVVEDEVATRRLMARLLRGLGHEVTAVGTIAEGSEAAEGGGFDLIVSDIGLPDGSGLELMRRVAARLGPVPAIALTGYGMEEDIVRSRAAGFTAHMTKPIDFTKLEAMIRQVASTRR